jgi:hypothetical protein
MNVFLEKDKVKLTFDSSKFKEIFNNSISEYIAYPYEISVSLFGQIIKQIFPNPGGLKLLDINAAYGSKLFSSGAMNLFYVGYSTLPNAKPIFDNIISNVKNVNTGFDCFMSYSDFITDVSLENSFFDICFVSPLLFGREKYPGDITSTNRFYSYEDWMVGYLFSSLKQAWLKLKVGGTLILDLQDYLDRYRQRVNIVEPVNLFIQQFLENSKLIGMIGIEQKKDNITGVWIWRKEQTSTSQILSRFDQLYPELYRRYLASISLGFAIASNPNINTIISTLEKTFDDLIATQPETHQKIIKQLLVSKLDFLPILLLTNPDKLKEFLMKEVDRIYTLQTIK